MIQQEEKATRPVTTVDLTKTVCPMTFLKAKIAVDEIPSGDVIEIILKSGEAMRDVPRSLKSEGHTIVQVRRNGETFHLFIRKDSGHVCDDILDTKQ